VLASRGLSSAFVICSSGEGSFSAKLRCRSVVAVSVTSWFLQIWVVSSVQTHNLEDQWVFLVWPLPFDLPGLCSLYRRQISCRHSSWGQRDKQAPPPTSRRWMGYHWKVDIAMGGNSVVRHGCAENYTP
jgi:hypothetical protein